MADSLFDSRYRYDYIYPRGRSGETLRAVDTQNKDRPVVIKRPAPGDAPPIRAAQEVSIANERRALQRLAKHPSLSELVGEGQFVVGGQAHQYIVIERAEGVVLADEVLALAGQGGRLPELEMCIIIDRLLDILAVAHTKDIVYNDVDAKHLFWNRQTYRLKLIDWGNAVFLAGDEVNPQGVSKQSDISQAGELLFFVLTGGRRPDVPRDAPDDWEVNFDQDAETVSARMKAIISRALHPNPRRRLAHIIELKRQLAEYRDPLERERDGMLGRVRERLRMNLSRSELVGLQATLEAAALFDPGFPAANQLRAEVEARLASLELAANLDAVRIYLDGGNYARAIDMLTELAQHADEDRAVRVAILLDLARTMNELHPQQALSDGERDGLALTFDGAYLQAAYALLTIDSDDATARKAQWLMAERISAHVPEVQLLRPNMYRLEIALAALAAARHPVGEARRVLSEVRVLLETMHTFETIAPMRDQFREVVDRLSGLQAPLTTVMVKAGLDESQLPIGALDRTTNAAMALADSMHVVGRQVVTSPSEARDALQIARAIDPINPAWAAADSLMTGLYQRLQFYQTFTPQADGSDIDGWLQGAQAELQPYAASFFDDILDNMVAGLGVAQRAWREFAATSVLGNRAGALEALAQAIDTVSMVSPSLSGWFGHLRAVVDNTRYVERHALYGGLGRTLSDGWEAFDKGRLGDAERLGEDSLQIARGDAERAAAIRLRNLARAAREWVERGGAGVPERTRAALEVITREYTPDEQRIRRDFDSQMPSQDTYLKAMGRGLVEMFGRSSTAGPRLLAFDFLLRATLETHAGQFDISDFYREAALRALGENGARHPMTRALDEFIERRGEVIQLGTLIDSLNSADSVAQIERVRKQVEDSVLGKSLPMLSNSLREIDSGLRDWGEGEFRTAGTHLESALRLLGEAESVSGLSAPGYRAWLDGLLQGTGALAVQMRALRQGVDRMPDMPSDEVREAHHQMVAVSVRLVGELIAAKLIDWRDTYEKFLAAYLDKSIRRSARLERFGELFRAMFIDRQPAYSLYRHWYTVTENAPEFPAPPTSDPLPTLREEADVMLRPTIAPPLDDDDAARPAPPPGRRSPQDGRATGGESNRLAMGGIAVGVLIVLIVLVVLLTRANTPGLADVGLTKTATLEPSLTPEPSPTATLIPTLAAALVLPSATPDSAVLPGLTPVTPDSVPIDVTPATETLTLTPSPDVPSETPTPEATFTPSMTPTATLPPDGIQGDQELLSLIGRLDPSVLPWTAEQFSASPDGGFWRLGVGGQTGGTEIQIPLDGVALDAAYGNNAPTRIRRIEAQISLATFDPTLPVDQIYFGVMLIPLDGSAPVGLKVEAQSLNQIALYQRRDGADSVVSQKAVNAVLGRIRIVRDINEGTASVFWNDEQVGPALPFVRGDVGVIPVLFVHDGGVVVNVSGWKVGLR